MLVKGCEGVGEILNKFYGMFWKDVVSMLHSDAYNGLSEDKCETVRKEFGSNKIKLKTSNNNFVSTCKAFFQGYIFILIIIFSFCLFNNEYILMSITGIFIIINIVMNIMITIKNNNNISYIQRVNDATVTVIRDNREKIIRAQDLVLGDIVSFKKGSLIGADLRIIEAKDLKVDEKNITGERFLKEKFENKLDGNIDNIKDMKNILFKGSIIVEGEGTGVVIEVGKSTEFGKLMSLIEYANNKHTLMNKINKKISMYSFILTIGAIVLSYILNHNLSSILLSATVVNSLPIAIIIMLEIKIIKADAMKQYGIELINMSTLDLIQDIDVLFIDKIGAITKDEMKLKSIYTNDEIMSMENVSYTEDKNIERAMDILLLCNDSVYNITEDSGTGNSTEIAYLRYAANNKIYKSILDSKYKRVLEVPMDSDKRVLTTINKFNRGYRANVRGNLDNLIDRCTHILIDGAERPLTDEDREKIKAVDYNYSVDGLLTQGVAYRNFSYMPSLSENIESNLVFTAIVALENLFKEDINASIEEVKNRGITPIVFTEDNKIAATYVGKRCNLISDVGGVISGIELESSTKEELKKLLSKVRLFSRVTPEIKGRIIAMFTKDNYNIASTGETLGDLASLSVSKVGIAKGEVPEVVRRVSDVYVKEDYIQKFLNIIDISKKFSRGVKNTVTLIISMLISEIMIINIARLINIKDNFNYITIFNIAMMILLSTITMDDEKKDQVINIYKQIIRCILWISFPLITVYKTKSSVSPILYAMFGMMIIGQVIIDSRISLKKLQRKQILLLISLFVLISLVVVIALFIGVHLTKWILIRGLILLVLYFIIELFFRKWA